MSAINDEMASPINILLAEDNEDDIEITKKAFEKARIKNNLFIVKNGEEALKYLKREDIYSDEQQYPSPQLVLLDINMPKVGGMEVLNSMKSNETLKLIPVVMLTSSKNDEDIVKSYGNGAAAYIAKPIDHNEFQKTVDAFNFFWQIVKFPKTN